MYNIVVSSTVEYKKNLSIPEQEQYVFYYHISIHNSGTLTAQLLRRSWSITDGNGESQIVEGDGVVGEKPTLPANSTYSYTSSAILKTPFGTMEGKYLCRAQDMHEFIATIPLFRLAVPNILQ